MVKELSTFEAADLLNVSRPFLVKLLNEGAIPHTGVGTHRRVQLKGIVAYKAHRDAEREKTLAHLTQMSQDMGLYA